MNDFVILKYKQKHYGEKEDKGKLQTMANRRMARAEKGERQQRLL